MPDFFRCTFFSILLDISAPGLSLIFSSRSKVAVDFDSVNKKSSDNMVFRLQIMRAGYLHNTADISFLRRFRESIVSFEKITESCLSFVPFFITSIFMKHTTTGILYEGSLKCQSSHALWRGYVWGRETWDGRWLAFQANDCRVFFSLDTAPLIPPIFSIKTSTISKLVFSSQWGPHFIP